MIDQIDKERHERQFDNIFSRLNKAVTNNVFGVTITVLMAFWASLFGLLYADLQGHKTIAIEQRIEVIRELGEVKVLIGQLKR
jgi:predicted PurR-regulated permease PerM